MTWTLPSMKAREQIGRLLYEDPKTLGSYRHIRLIAPDHRHSVSTAAFIFIRSFRESTCHWLLVPRVPSDRPFLCQYRNVLYLYQSWSEYNCTSRLRKRLFLLRRLMMSVCTLLSMWTTCVCATREERCAQSTLSLTFPWMCGWCIQCLPIG